MGSSHQISLKWDHYLKHITCAFDTLRTDEDLVDVTLSCEGKRIRAHKMLLSACSTYFRDLFKENPCQHPIIIFRNVKFDDLIALINFIYQGEVNIVQEQLASFLTTAKLLAVQGLTDVTGMDDSLVEDDIEIPNESEVQLQNTSSKSSKFTGDNKRNKSSSSLMSYHVIDLQPEVPPNKRRKIQESTNVNAEKNSSGINANDSDGKTSESQMGPDSDPLVIIPPITNLKVEMPEYLEQDGSSCSYEDQSIGDNTLNKIATDDTSTMSEHGQKTDTSQTFYSSQSASDGLDGHLLSKPSTSRERTTQDAVQENEKELGDLSDKRNHTQNRKHKDCSMLSVSKCCLNTDNQQNMGKKLIKSKCNIVYSKKNAKNTLSEYLLREDSTSMDELSSTSSDENYEHKLFSQTQKKKTKKHETLENKLNLPKHKISNKSPKKEDLQEMLQEALTTIAELKKRITKTKNNPQNDVTPTKHFMNVSVPLISTEPSTSTRNNFIEDLSQQSDIPCTTSIPNTVLVNTPKRNKLQPQNSDSGEEDIRHLEQLYGKNWPNDTMVMLRNEVYCRQSVLYEALGASSKASHLVRRLLLGVFKKDAFCHVTLTGRPPRGAGREQNDSQLFSLDGKAKFAIIKYSQNIAKKRGWKKQSSKSLLHAMTQRIGEIKRDIKNAQQSQLDALHVYLARDTTASLDSM